MTVSYIDFVGNKKGSWCMQLVDFEIVAAGFGVVAAVAVGNLHMYHTAAALAAV